MAFYISLENKLDIDNDSDIISSHTGGGGGGVTAGDASTSTTQDLRIASLFQLLWIDEFGISFAHASVRGQFRLYKPSQLLSSRVKNTSFVVLAKECFC